MKTNIEGNAGSMAGEAGSSAETKSVDPKPSFWSRFLFDRVELAGSFGDLGTLLPIVVGMILINKLSPTTVFLSFGLFYIITAFYFRLPIPVQPLKAVGAIAIAFPDRITEPVIGASGVIFGVLLLLFSLTGIIDKLAKIFTPPVVRGIQLSLGLVFLRKGIELIVNKNLFMSGVVGKFPGSGINLILGVLVFAMVLLLLDNRKVPAAIAAIAVGILAGLSLGGLDGQKLSFGPTKIHVLSFSLNDLWIAFIMLILPQIPLTIGNACVGTADTCSTLFPADPRLSKTKAGNFALTMGLANLPAGFFGAVPMCHGTGGLAAHYRFGARTGGAPLMIGVILVILALAFGDAGFTFLTLLPNSVLGVLLIFAGLELCPLIRSLKSNEEYFVALLISGIALAVPNMAWAFGTGIAVDWFIRKAKIKI
ncbi:MAG: sulfate permease [Desulfobacteraceae bacterium]|nr:sulfate permease [Desulfobacteraceae bacterium]MBU4002930.1 putative sulfate/molybdate transporter [Pseudomonadota bacterium]